MRKTRLNRARLQERSAGTEQRVLGRATVQWWRDAPVSTTAPRRIGRRQTERLNRCSVPTSVGWQGTESRLPASSHKERGTTMQRVAIGSRVRIIWPSTHDGLTRLSHRSTERTTGSTCGSTGSDGARCRGSFSHARRSCERIPKGPNRPLGAAHGNHTTAQRYRDRGEAPRPTTNRTRSGHRRAESWCPAQPSEQRVAVQGLGCRSPLPGRTQRFIDLGVINRKMLGNATDEETARVHLHRPERGRLPGARGKRHRDRTTGVIKPEQTEAGRSEENQRN